VKLGVHILTITALLSFALASGQAADSIQKTPANLHTRKWIIGTGTGVTYISTLAVLNEAWYKGYPKSKFHSFNDGGEWLQMDKIGHAWTAYNSSRVGSALWKWAGVQPRTAVLLGTGSSLAYMLSIEYLDGRSAEWGWSWPDVSADIAGAALYAVQELTAGEQIFSVKWSGHYRQYHPASLEHRADILFGKSFPERILKDYNTQTYWLSAPVKKIFASAPAWLNISIGYGADGMFGGYENFALNTDGTVAFDGLNIPRSRQWYIAPDVDFTKIKTRSGFLRAAFGVMNAVKFPAPALSLSRNKLRFHALAF
jgi:uncharacterized protein YfiM (DUF2279 family)